MGTREEERRRLQQVSRFTGDPALHGAIDLSLQKKEPQVRDHLGRVLTVGDGVLPASSTQELYRVDTIEPMTRNIPGMPPGLMRVRMVSVIDAVVPRESCLEGVYRVAAAGEKRPDMPGQPAGGDQQGQAPPEDLNPPPTNPPAEQPAAPAAGPRLVVTDAD